MFRKIVTAIIVVPLAVVIVAFAVANRQAVTVSFDPFSAASPAYAATLPLFVADLRGADPRRADRRHRRLAPPEQMAAHRPPARRRGARAARGDGDHPPPLRHVRAGRRAARSPPRCPSSRRRFLNAASRGSALRRGGEGGRTRLTMALTIKICGLKTPEALDVALESGADLVGFVFFAPSPRNLGLEAARALGAARARAAPARSRSPSMPMTRRCAPSSRR